MKANDNMCATMLFMDDNYMVKTKVKTFVKIQQSLAYVLQMISIFADSPHECPSHFKYSAEVSPAVEFSQYGEPLMINITETLS